MREGEKLSDKELLADINTENESDKDKIIIEMQAQINELTEKVNKLCEQTEGGCRESVARSEIDDGFEEKPKNKTKKKKFAWVGEIFFYSMLILLVLGAFFIRSSSNGRPITIAGYSAFTVLTSSMESEIPKGSLVISKTVDPETLKIGDDITFMSGPTSTITHRIIGITEEYLDTKARAFETQGIMNSYPDKEPVPAVNVVGKVVYHNKTVGDIANFVSDNWPFMVFILVITIALFTVLKRVFKDDTSKKAEKIKKRE